MFGPYYAYIDCSNLCSTCGWPVCDVDCEVVPAHKDAECGVFANAKVKFTPVENTYEPGLQYECITPLRVLLATERDKDRWENQVKCMETHTEERKRKEGSGISIRVYLRAALPLKKGDELFAGYTYSMWPTIVRREYLREDDEAEWKCTHCPNTLKGSTIRKVFKMIQEEIDQVESMPQDSMSIEARESLWIELKCMGKSKGTPWIVLPDVLYERKVELCQQILENINILEPGWSRLRGITMYELHAPIIMLARNLYNNDVIDKSELRAKLMEAIELLRESSQILILEPENSSEGMIGQAAMQAYQQLSANLDDLVENA
ncbi:set and mynd domain containing arthropod-specific member 4 isoform a [Holotrichia oblita]|uniref:Set and mynd domain containing arthropod-specific member 4 isoform a n=1 Tax=Holotrichia oblita TaxID=644536 RepID=A0ACB9TZ27_HOLOL|nr:set and mynd domain containing arthropod-specific member 4 isoform a [Holotrichia oblita]